MNYSREPRHKPDRWLAQQVHELGIPAPFDLGSFPTWLERRSHRRVRLVAASLAPDCPPGLLVRGADADYLYYEGHTSKFHQAHIALCLAARILCDEGTGTPIDMRLMPNVCPRAIHLMLGQPTGTITDAEAETFAHLVLDQSSQPYPPLLALRAMQRLRPLLTGLGEVVQDTHPPIGGRRSAARTRLHCRVIAIRDAMLTLTPYRDPQVALAAAVAARARGLTGQDRAAAVEAAVLSRAIQAKKAQLPRPRSPGATRPLPSPDGDLRSETEWLAGVARAWPRAPQESCLDQENNPGRQPGRLSPPVRIDQP